MDLIEKIESLLQRIEAGDCSPRIFEELAKAQKELMEYYKELRN